MGKTCAAGDFTRWFQERAGPAASEVRERTQEEVGARALAWDEVGVKGRSREGM